jgi:hypothetical protein
MKKLASALFALALLFATSTSAAVVDAVEYYHAQFNHYFITAETAEIAALDGGAFGGAWVRTGGSFKVNNIATTGASPVCRFFSTSFAPKSSHFYTALASECANLRVNPNWQFEANAFYVAIPSTSGVCSAGDKVYRLYNNGMSGAPNHRFTTSLATRNAMIQQGWVAEGYGEGVTFCTATTIIPPPPPPPPTNLALSKSQQLVGGVWRFSYTFGTHSYVDTFRFTKIEVNTDPGSAAQVPYWVLGTNRWNETALAGYSYSVNKFMLLSALLNTWDGYVFDFTSTNTIAGCYDFALVASSLFDNGRCSPLLGARTATALEETFAPKSSVDVFFEKSQHLPTGFAVEVSPLASELQALIPR